MSDWLAAAAQILGQLRPWCGLLQFLHVLDALLNGSAHGIRAELRVVLELPELCFSLGVLPLEDVPDAGTFGVGAVKYGLSVFSLEDPADVHIDHGEGAAEADEPGPRSSRLDLRVLLLGLR
jgi:hypothetical protein